MSADGTYRYRQTSQNVRLSMLLPGATTAYQGRRATVVEVRERTLDGGKWAVVLDFGDGGKPLHVGGPAEAVLPVFADPYPVCSCHGDPWPCNEAWQAQQDQRQRQVEEWEAAHRCAACGQKKNLGPLRYGIHPDRRRYCRRVACVREAERWGREVHNARHREQRERNDFAAQMRDALGDPA